MLVANPARMVQPIFGNLEVFDYIYANSCWGIGSGDGSSIQAVLPYKKYLENFILSKNIKSIVDLGCGDWQFSQFVDYNSAHYRGYDVAQSVIDENNKRFSSDKVEFFMLENYKTLPGADLLICKDVLQHLSSSEIFKILDILPGYKYALITNEVINMSKLGRFLWRLAHPRALPLLNREIEIGDCRPLDPTREPFRLNATLALQWKINTLGIRDRLRQNNFFYGIDCQWKKRTYLYVNDALS